MMDRRIPAPIIRIRIGRLGRPPERVDGVQGRTKKLTYVDSEKQADKLTLVLNNDDERFPDDPVFEHGSELIASWGYAGRMTPERSFIVQKWKPGVPEFTVEAHGRGILIHKDKRVRSWHDVRRSDVARILAEEAGFGPEMQFIEDTSAYVESIQQPAITDATLLTRMAKKESKNGVAYVFYIDRTGFHFHPRRVDAPPRRRIVYVGPGMGDLLEYPDFDASVAAKAGKVTLEGQDPVTKEPIKAVASDETTAGRPGLAQVKLVLDRETGARSFRVAAAAETVAATSASSQTEADAAAGALFAKKSSAPVKCKLKMRGDPTIEAKIVVELAGIAKRLSGNYYLKDCTHTVTPGSFEITAKAQRDGLSGGAAGAPTPTSSATVNDAEGAAPGAAPTLQPVLNLDRETGERRVSFRPGPPNTSGGS